MAFSAERGGYLVSDERGRLDEKLVCDYLRGSYWASEVPREGILRSIRNSHAFGLYGARGQVGFARAVTDYARFAYLADVFVLDGHRGRGLGRWLVRCVLDHPELRGVRRWMLATRDAHGLYRPFGFAPPDEPARLMQRSFRGSSEGGA